MVMLTQPQETWAGSCITLRKKFHVLYSRRNTYRAFHVYRRYSSNGGLTSITFYKRRTIPFQEIDIYAILAYPGIESW